jgi:hypothetical protein
VIDTASTSQPPLWPSVGALLVSGWAGGMATAVLWAPLLGAARLGSAFAPGAFTATSLVPTLAGALAASVLLPRLLRVFCEFELSLGAAFVVTLGRSLAGFAVSMVFVATFRSTVVPASATFFLLPQVLSLVVGYQPPEALGPTGSEACPERSGADLARAGAGHTASCGR